MPRIQSTGGDWGQICLGVLALGLASCAVVAPQGAAGQGEPPSSPRSAMEGMAVLAQPECRHLARQREGLQKVHAALAREGMALQVLGCPRLPAQARAAVGQRVVAVAVRVIDGERAADTVRGPLADGELLDMGTQAPQAQAGPLQRVSAESLAQPAEDALSPDVLYNRDWLRKRMQEQGLRAVDDAWWAFAAP